MKATLMRSCFAMLARRSAFVLAGAFGLLTATCASDDGANEGGQAGGASDASPCAMADSKFATCGVLVSPSEDCTGPYRCLAECVNSASCEEIRDPDNSPVYAACVENAVTCP
jgi:hypothetical protein